MSQAFRHQPDEAEHWEPIPNSVISSEGHVVDTSGLQWHMPTTSGRFATLKFQRIRNLKFRYALMRYCVYVMRTSTAGYAYTTWVDCHRFLLLPYPEFNREEVADFEVELISYYEKMLAATRQDHRLYQVSRVKSWYLWGCQYLSEVGFYALHTTTCSDVTECQQRAALALFIAHGRNPANLSWLR